MKLPPSDPYCYPHTDVLRNLKEIHDPTELAAFEAAIVALRLVRLTEEPIIGQFNVDRLRETHRRIFGAVYPWAGQFRLNTGIMTKHRLHGHSVVYADSSQVPSAVNEVFEKLRADKFLQGLPASHLAHRVAWFYSELDAVHPFRDGNSRTLRQFFSDLVQERGYRIDWRVASATEDDRQKIILARDLAVIRGDISLLSRIIEHHLHPLPSASR